jgi:mannose-1-phosphate guanylyltransferase/phosphomannomutase
MMPFVNEPVLAHILNLLKHYHVFEVILTVQYKADQIQDYFGNGSHLGMTLHYAMESIPLGTAGSVKNAQPYLDDETFLVISGDAITDIDLSGILRFHREKQALATLALKRVAHLQEYGVVMTDDNGRITEYLDNPGQGSTTSNTVNAGIYVLEPEVLDYMEPDQVYDFSYDIFPLMLSQGALLFGYLADGYWRDMGTLQSYVQAMADMLAGEVRHINPVYQVNGNGWTDRGLEIMPNGSLYRIALEASHKLALW